MRTPSDLGRKGLPHAPPHLPLSHGDPVPGLSGEGAGRPALASCLLPAVGAGREAGAPAGTQAPPTTSPTAQAACRARRGLRRSGAPQPLALPLWTMRVGQTCPDGAGPPSDPGARVAGQGPRTRPAKVLSAHFAFPRAAGGHASSAELGARAGGRAVSREGEAAMRCRQHLSSGRAQPRGHSDPGGAPPSGTLGVTVCLGVTGSQLYGILEAKSGGGSDMSDSGYNRLAACNCNVCQTSVCGWDCDGSHDDHDPGEDVCVTV